MTRILANQLNKHLHQQVVVRGWLHSVRPFGKLTFLVLRDRSGLCQVVIQDKATSHRISSLQPGSIITVTGISTPSQQAELKVEIIEPQVSIEVPITTPLPLEYNKPVINADIDYILDHRPLSLRNRSIQAVFRIQGEIAHAYRLYMHDVVGAYEYFSPNILGASSEGGAEFFHVDYFGHSATLAQSSQLYKQIMVGVNERVFALAPFFRAEPSQTTRHLTEGKQFEFEMGFFNHWHEILDIQEGVLKFIVRHLEKSCSTEIELLGGKLINIPQDVPIPRLTFKQAQELYYQRTGHDERNEPDLSPSAERELCKYALEKHGTDLIFITDWLLLKRPFYAAPNEDDPELSNTFDLLCGGSEITSGGQRRHTYESMLEGIKSKSMDPAEFSDYLSIFQYGMPPHGGFGMGLERLTMTLLHLKNIREASLFPSDPKRIAANRIRGKIFFGGENVRNEIIRLLRHQDIVFEHLRHEETPTSEDSARVRGTTLSEGVKSIIVRGKNSKKNYHINVPSHMKLDMKAVSEAVGEKCEFEDAGVIQERFGLIVGGVPPFGTLLNLETFFDENITKESRAAFNCGLRTESIVMQAQDLVKVVQPKLGRFAKE